MSLKHTQHFREEAFTSLKKHRYQHAVVVLNQALQVCPDDFQSLYYRGLCWFRQKEFQKAIKDCTETLWIYPIHSSAYVLRGTSRFCLGFIQEAIDDYETALGIDSTSAFAYQQRSYVRAYLKDFDGANRDMEQAIRLFSAQRHPELTQFLPFSEDMPQDLVNGSISDISPT